MKISTKYLMTSIAALLFYVVPALAQQNPIEEAKNVLDNMGISFSSAIEIEAAYQRTDAEDTNDITTATVQLALALAF